MEAKANSGRSVQPRGLILPIVIFILGFLAYLVSALGAVLANTISVKFGLAILAGALIANLAIIGHDAVHRSFTRLRWLNRVIGTVAFLPALHPYGRWEYHHNRIHHCFTAQIGIDNAYPPMTPEQYKWSSPYRRLHYRFMRSLWGQPFFYLVDIWWPNMFIPFLKRGHDLDASDAFDLSITYGWLILSVVGFALVSWTYEGAEFRTALSNGAVFGVLIPFLVWNVFISFVTIVQHTGPKVRWVMPTGRFSTRDQLVGGTIHIVFPDALDWFFHRVMQHVVHHVNPIIPLYRLKLAEAGLLESEATSIIEVWTPLYHWRMTRDCKLYDTESDRWCGYSGVSSEARANS
jgi:acyl-lipid omega-6 desaturase (Delta-12 desaturase)